MRNTATLAMALASLALSCLAMWQIENLWSGLERPGEPGMTEIMGAEDLAKFIEKQASDATAANFRDGPPIQIPTGIFIQSAAFSSATVVNLTGYIWQTYPKDFPYEIGFTFPEQIASGDTQIKEAYRQDEVIDGNAYVVIGFYFDVTTQQIFDYSNYPLDYQTIWLRLWPKEFIHDRDVLFTPDFRSYSEPHRDVFGIDKYIVQGEWETDRTWYSYGEVTYDTNFGLRSQPKLQNYQELFFNLGVRRIFMNAFIINLVPLFAVGLLLFSTLMTISSDKQQSDRFGFSTTGLLGTCSALFFVVLIGHVQVRNLFAGSRLVYIEYFYIIMYVAILVVALNGYLFSVKAPREIIQLRRGINIFAKLAFWPALLWAMAFITWRALK